MMSWQKQVDAIQCRVLSQLLTEKYTSTPAKGEPMPQTQEYWEKRAQSDHYLIMNQKDEISLLKTKINKLSQKIEQLRRK